MTRGTRFQSSFRITCFSISASRVVSCVCSSCPVVPSFSRSGTWRGECCLVASILKSDTRIWMKALLGKWGQVTSSRSEIILSQRVRELVCINIVVRNSQVVVYRWLAHVTSIQKRACTTAILWNVKSTARNRIDNGEKNSWISCAAQSVGQYLTSAGHENGLVDPCSTRLIAVQTPWRKRTYKHFRQAWPRNLIPDEANQQLEDLRILAESGVVRIRLPSEWLLVPLFSGYLVTRLFWFGRRQAQAYIPSSGASNYSV
jgi:hypothetical protein